jgi:hypothetical protein
MGRCKGGAIVMCRTKGACRVHAVIEVGYQSNAFKEPAEDKVSGDDLFAH